MRSQETNQFTRWLPIILLLVVCVAEFAFIYRGNSGRFIYTLDDPYIHLALAEGISHGYYGINPGEFAAPSSSIIWPFLLAPFARFTVGEYVPFILSLLAAVGTLAFASRILADAFGPAEDTKTRWAVALIVALLIPSLNLAGLVFTGMEHSLQVLLAVMMVWGIIAEQKTKNVSWWLIVAIVIGPLVRYENLALALPALGYLGWRRRWRPLFLSGAILFAALAGYSLFLRTHGSGPLPNSVMAKSFAVSSAGSFWVFLENVRINFVENLKMRPAVLLGAGLFALIYYALSRRRASEDRGLAGWAAVAALLHLLFGNFHGFFRYEIYVWAVVLLTLVYLHRDRLRELLSDSPERAFVLACLFAGLICLHNFHPLTITPLASNNIYEQQYQMYRFVAEYYRAPVAVNDIGWVSYRNDNYVLDLFGLASNDALRLRRTSLDTAWMNQLAGQHDVRLAMIYDDWRLRAPANWTPLGELRLGKKNVSSARPVVTFYAIVPEEIARAKAALGEFQKTLPEDVGFVFRK